MEKQEIEMKWKLERETENKWKCNLLAVVVIQMLLVFVPRHPSALPSSSFCLHPQLCVIVSLGSLFMFHTLGQCLCSILSNQLILYKYALYMHVLRVGLLYPGLGYEAIICFETGSGSRNEAARVGMLALFQNKVGYYGQVATSLVPRPSHM